MRVETIGDATLLLGDCRSILPTIGAVDACITDPPYGIGLKYAGYDDTRDNLSALIRDVIRPAIAGAKRTIITPGQTQVWLYPEAKWISAITWDTTGTFGACGFSQWMPLLFYGDDVPGFARTNSGVLKSDLSRFTGGAGVGFNRTGRNEHPCPKPENVMQTIVARYTDRDETTLDLFMGSGTTGVACARLGRRFIGVEISERYFTIACRRIEEAYRQRDLFISAPVADDPADARLVDLFAEPEA